MAQRINIDVVKQLAHDRGGKCLSEIYKNNTKLKWKCSEGHVWEATPSNIKRGRWCPYCSRARTRGSIEEMQKIAETKGGSCLSNIYKDSRHKLEWMCSKDHIWKTTPSIIGEGSWCPYCSNVRKVDAFMTIQVIAYKRGGSCLSKSYKGSNEKLEWKCKKGHVWKTTPSIIKQGSWCPECSQALRRGSIDEMQKLANERGGSCLSQTYEDYEHKLKWKCKEGHVWEAKSSRIKKGSWCRRCRLGQRK